jgi:hypothetical protein
MKKGTPLKMQGALKTSDEKEGTPNKCNPIKTPSMIKESPCKKKELHHRRTKNQTKSSGH